MEKENVKELSPNFIKGVFYELKNVTWLGPKKLAKMTLIVLLTTIVATLITWGLDVLFTNIIKLIIK